MISIIIGIDTSSVGNGIESEVETINYTIPTSSIVGTKIGFNDSETDNIANSRGIIEKNLRKTFKPEFINRLDDIVYFKDLIKEDILKILEVELSKVIPRIESLGYRINLTQRLKEDIAEKGYDPKFGARPLKRIVQRYIEDSIADLMVTKKAEEGSTITLDYDEKKAEKEQMPVKISVRKNKSKKK